MKRIIVFLASSINEFADERLELKDLSRRLTDQLIDYGVRIRLFICEYADNAISAGRMQDEFNSEIDNSDLFLMLVGRNLGEYTREEYEYALASQRKRGIPKIIIAKKNYIDDDSFQKMIKICQGVDVVNFNSSLDLMTLFISAINNMTGEQFANILRDVLKSYGLNVD